MRKLAALGALLAIAAAALYFYADGFFPAPVPEGPATFSYLEYADALKHVGPDGRVDYAALKADRASLDAFVEQLARVSPLNRPEAFPENDDKLAYWINAYNALALDAVLDRYPELKSVDEPGLTSWNGVRLVTTR